MERKWNERRRNEYVDEFTRIYTRAHAAARLSATSAVGGRALAIELVWSGIANSRIRAPPHVHLRSQGSRPSLCRVLNEELNKKNSK